MTARSAMLCVVSVFALGACAPTMDDFKSEGSQPDRKAQDFAACRITATQMMGQYGGGLIAISAYNQTLNDCMTAKGYASN